MSYSKLGLLLGDPSGIGPEFCAKLLEERSGWESNRVVLIGEPSLFENGKKIAGIELEAPLVQNIREIPNGGIGMLQGPELQMEGSVLERQVKPAAVMHSILSAGLRHCVNQASWTVFVSHQ